VRSLRVRAVETVALSRLLKRPHCP
jgi:hypothetical protein